VLSGDKVQAFPTSSGHDPMRTAIKLGYGIGQIGTGVKNTAFSIFLFFYYNQVLGVPGSLAGIASLLALLIDAITDPMVGQMSDRLKSRWGRRHPFMLIGAAPFGLALYLLFAPPAGLDEYGLFAWLLGFAILVRVLLTFFFVPHLSLGAEIVRDYHERTALIGYRMFFQMGGGLFVSMVGLVIFFPPSETFANGMLNAASYPGFAVFAGILGTVAMLWSIFATRSTIPLLSDPIVDPDAAHPILGFITVFRTLKQFAFRKLFLTMLVFTTIVGVTQTLIIYTGTYLFGFSPQQLAIAAASPVLGVLFGPLAIKKMSQIYDKKNSMIICLILGSIFGFSTQTAFLFGILEPMSVENRLIFVFLMNGVSQIFFVGLYIVMDSMLSDTIDQHELDTGRREEGLFFSASSFAQKASFGLGALVAGIGLDVIRFPKGADVGDVPMEILTDFAIFAGPLMMILLVSSTLIIRTYPIDQQEHTRILQEIRGMRVEGT
jgi:Na+/melibiose symporter-like transporter